MSRGTVTFKKGDLVRAIAAVRAAGIEVARVEVDKAGKIVIITGKPEQPKSGEGTEWDRL
jgi:hypothetical protein